MMVCLASDFGCHTGHAEICLDVRRHDCHTGSEQQCHANALGKSKVELISGIHEIIIYLVGGFNPSEKYWSGVSWDDYSQYMGK